MIVRCPGGHYTRDSCESSMSIFGRVLAWCVSGLNNVTDDFGAEAPNDTAYKRWSCHSELKLLCKLCRTSPPPAMGSDLPFLGMPAMRTRWMAGAVAHKSW